MGQRHDISRINLSVACKRKRDTFAIVCRICQPSRIVPETIPHEKRQTLAVRRRKTEKFSFEVGGGVHAEKYTSPGRHISSVKKNT